MTGAALIFLLMWTVMLIYETSLVKAQNQCTTNAGCLNTNAFCCKGYFIDRRSCQFSSCLGRRCSTDGDCGGRGECCKFNKCVTVGCPECNSHFNCAPSEYCCKHRYHKDHNVCRRSCVRETCHSRFDCAVGECCKSNRCVKYGCASTNVHQCFSNLDCPVSLYCCKRGLLSNVCRRSCVGEICFSGKGCGGPGEQCDSSFKCSISKTTNSEAAASLAGWVIGIIVTGAIVLVSVIGGIWLCRRRKRPLRTGAVIQQQGQAAPAIITQQTTQMSLGDLGLSGLDLTAGLGEVLSCGM